MPRLGTNGGLIGPRRVATTGNASGSWALDEQCDAVRQAIWPSAGGDPYWANVSLLLHMDGSNGSTTFTDSSGTPKTVTVNGGAAISTAESKFGGSSAAFNGSNDSLTFADIGLGTDDFTIEMFFKTNSSVQYATLIGNETSGASAGFSLMINKDSSTGGQIAVYRTGNLVVESSSGDWSDNAWHHVAFVRSGSAVTLYIDGTSYGSSVDSASYNGITYVVGRNDSFAPRNMIGYIDDLRITKAARYNSSFTPPTAAFPNG